VKRKDKRIDFDLEYTARNAVKLNFNDKKKRYKMSSNNGILIEL